MMSSFGAHCEKHLGSEAACCIECLSTVCCCDRLERILVLFTRGICTAGQLLSAPVKTMCVSIQVGLQWATPLPGSSRRGVSGPSNKFCLGVVISARKTSEAHIPQGRDAAPGLLCP